MMRLDQAGMTGLAAAFLRIVRMAIDFSPQLKSWRSISTHPVESGSISPATFWQTRAFGTDWAGSAWDINTVSKQSISTYRFIEADLNHVSRIACSLKVS